MAPAMTEQVCNPILHYLLHGTSGRRAGTMTVYDCGSCGTVRSGQGTDGQ